MGMNVSWISAGVSSFIAGWLERDIIDEYIYIDVDDQHPDSMRFVKECEKALGKEIKILKSEYGCVENAIRGAGMIKLPSGYAPCTNWLKKRVRKQWEHEQTEHITYFWGFDADEKHRAERLQEGMQEFEHRFPMIERNLSKLEVHGILDRLGIKRPKMYDLGYNNNNCIGCIKGGMGYWNAIRKDFPDVFKKRAELERIIGHSILKECYLDELDENRGRISRTISQDCDIFCQINFNEGIDEYEGKN